MSFAPAQPNDNSASTPASREVTPVVQAAHADIGPDYLREAGKLSSGSSNGNISDSGNSNSGTGTDGTAAENRINSLLNPGDTSKLYSSVITGTSSESSPEGSTDPNDGGKNGEKKLSLSDSAPKNSSEATPEAPLRSEAPSPTERPPAELSEAPSPAEGRHERLASPPPADMRLARSAGGG